ncbi:MAG: alpha/beta hydrolase [Pseudomonadota bacterium]
MRLIRRASVRGPRARVVAALAAIAIATPSAVAAAVLSPFSECQLKSQTGPQQRSAECARLRVAEDPSQADGAQIELFVARIRSLRPEPEKDAVLLINGGPGGSSVELYLSLGPAFARLLEARDLLVLDQRGTGRSNPLLCPEALAGQTDPFDDALPEGVVGACLDELQSDPRHYTTSVAVQDIEALRIAGGYERLTLYGVSYGTRVALHYLRRYPDAVRALILDGLVPPEVLLGPNIALNADATLTQIFARCADTPACARRYPDLGDRFRANLAALKQQRIDLRVDHPISGRAEPQTYGYTALAVVLRLLNYAPETAALVPYLVEEALAGRFEAITAQALMLMDNLNEALAMGMHNAVACTEDAPFLPSPDAAARTQLEATFIGAAQSDALRAMCAQWPRGPLDPAFHEPLVSDKPVLLLSGEFDPITPPAYGAITARTLANARHIVAPGQGHGVIGRGCIPRLAAEFVAAGSAAELDAACVDDLAPLPFFLGPMGPVAASPASAREADTP